MSGFIEPFEGQKYRDSPEWRLIDPQCLFGESFKMVGTGECLPYVVQTDLVHLF